ncbi:MAG: REP element-mobilizing transposase RayT [Crocinitomicaceae bacterium]|jgi:REP element-mobilizing transposase RayT
MDKRIKLELPNQHYYIEVPCHGNQHLFSSVFAYDALLNTLKQQDGMDLLGYCLLPNSMHLLLLSKTEPALWLEPWLMQYNQWHQSSTGDSGYLFADDNKKQVLVQPRFLVKALKYIHRIPVVDKLCSKPDQFPYSSFQDYIGTQDTGVNTAPLLAAISHYSGQRIRRFRDYMQTSNKAEHAELPNGNDDIYSAYADRAFIAKAMSLYANGEELNPEQQQLQLWHQCLAALSETTQLDTPTLLGIRRHHSLPDAHFLLAWLYIKEAKGPMHIAAKQLELDEVTLKLNINSIHLHHPEAYLRYIASNLKTSLKVA